MKYFSLFSGVGGFELGISQAYEENQRMERQRASRVAVPGRRKTIDRAGVDHQFSGASGHQRAQGLEPPVCVGFSEIDPFANSVLRYRFPNVRNYGDIKKIDWGGSDVPDFDLLVGGSPCQDLSIAGGRAGLKGSRSGLFHQFVRALEEKGPRHFIWENVRGALSSNRGKDFANVLDSLAGAGYSLWWQVLNAKDFGVPQNRERIFVVGTRNGDPREVFFESCDDEEAPGSCSYPLKARADSSIDRKHPQTLIEENSKRSQGSRVTDPRGRAPSLQSSDGGGAAGKPLIISSPRGKFAGKVSGLSPALTKSRFESNHAVAVARNQRGEVREMKVSGSLAARPSGKQFNGVFDHRSGLRENGPNSMAIDANYAKGVDGHGQRTVVIEGDLPQSQRVYRPEGIAPTLAAKNSRKTGGQAGVRVIQRTVSTNSGQNGRGAKIDDKSYTVTGRGEQGIATGTRIRRLTPIECERLMGWPDNWTQFGCVNALDVDGEEVPISDSQRYKMCGNGVVAPVVAAVVKAHLL